jgi:PAS domain-containing protein
MSVIRIDERALPLVRVHFPGGVLSDDALATYLEGLRRIAARGAPYATLTDLSAANQPLTPSARSLFDAWMERTERELAPLAAGNAIVAPTPIARAVAHTVYWHWRRPARHRVFAGVAPAERWCRARLRRGPITGESAPAAEAPGEPADALAALVDLFDEPSFLLDDEGRVVFASRVARAAFAPPYGWVARALSGGAGAETTPIRAARVGALRLVIVDDGAGLSDLPASLRRIAQRLRMGETDKEIAASTGLSLASVRTYVRRLYARLGVHGRRELMRRRG